MEPALELLVALGLDAQPDQEVYTAMVHNILKNRVDAKADQRTCFQRLQMYMQYGPENSATQIISEETLRKTTPDELLAKVRALFSYGVDVYYYGRKTWIKQVTSLRPFILFRRFPRRIRKKFIIIRKS